MGNCKKCGTIRSSDKLFDGCCNKCKDVNATSDKQDDDYESFECDDCGKMCPIDPENEEKDFCDYCEKGLCPSCLKKHNEIKNAEVCAFLHKN